MSAFSWFVFRSFFIYFLSGSNFRIVHEKEIFKNFYSKYICFSFTMMNLNHDRARDLKNSGKYGSGLSCRWALFPAWAFGFKLHLIFHRVEFKKLVSYFVDFHGRNWRIPGFMRTRLNTEPCFPLKPTRAGNFWMVDIGINAWSTLFLNLQIKYCLFSSWI